MVSCSTSLTRWVKLLQIMVCTALDSKGQNYLEHTRVFIKHRSGMPQSSWVMRRGHLLPLFSRTLHFESTEGSTVAMFGHQTKLCSVLFWLDLLRMQPMLLGFVFLLQIWRKYDDYGQGSVCLPTKHFQSLAQTATALIFMCKPMATKQGHSLVGPAPGSSVFN